MAPAMDDERRKRDEIGSAPTTPALDASPAPEGTLDIPPGDAVAANPDSVPGPGAAIGHFIVRERLGAGGMGVVLRCDDADLGRAVALKLVRADAEHPAYRARLLREAQAMARLEHPNVVKVYEVGSDRGRLFIAMELVAGQTLSAWLREARAWRDVVDMFVQVGDGLAAVHAAGLVHRDFKPDNVLVDRNARARVADFGLARIETAEGQPLTKTGALMGTPGYMAPEQQFGADVDARADQYSFCVALREALGGRPLDEARWAKVPKEVRAAVTRGLSYEPGERFASMAELLAALRAVHAPASEPRWMVALLALAVLGTVSGIVVYFNSRGGTRAEVALAHDAPVRADERPPTVIDPIDEPAPTVEPTPPGDAAEVERAVAQAPPKDAGIDAAVARTVVRPDASMRRARSAGTQVAAVMPDAGVAAAAVMTDAGVAVAARPTLNVTGPTSKKLPESQPGHPGHLPIVRRAIAKLGYDGFDASLSADALEKTIEAATGIEQAIAKVRLGQLKRRKGDCPVANVLWEDAAKVLDVKGSDDDKQWSARAWIGRSLCALAAGKADDAFELVTHAWVHGNRDQVQLLMGMIKFEQGEKDLAYASMLVSERSKDPTVQAALKAWLDGLGFTLH
jgi:predicted Ser/Thr protein kinase